MANEICGERRRQLTELQQRLKWAQLQKARLLDDLDELRRQNAWLQERLDELSDFLNSEDDQDGGDEG